MSSDPQATDAVLMIRPVQFGFHAEAAESNAFASPASAGDLQAALREFDTAVEALDSTGIEVVLLDDSPEPPKPDAVFPNNWVTLHGDGTMVLYPMATSARRLERGPEKLKRVLAKEGFDVLRTVDLSFHERNGHFLEGTGSLVLDRPERRAYANVSARTDPTVIADFDDRLEYSTFLFDANDRSGRAIYHTNVLMSLGTRFGVLCADAVAKEYCDILIGEIESSGRTLIQVDYEQMRHFACNVLELKGRDGPAIALSSTARRSFRPNQLRLLESFGQLVEADIPTIERVGGGSLRCMIAEIHLPRRST